MSPETESGIAHEPADAAESTTENCIRRKVGRVTPLEYFVLDGKELKGHNPKPGMGTGA